MDKYYSLEEYGYNIQEWTNHDRERVQLKILTYAIIRDDIKRFAKNLQISMEDLITHGTLKFMHYFKYEENLQQSLEQRIDMFFDQFNFKSENLIEKMKTLDENLENVKAAAISDYIVELESRKRKTYAQIIKHICLHPGTPPKNILREIAAREAVPLFSAEEALQLAIDDRILVHENGKLYPA